MKINILDIEIDNLPKATVLEKVRAFLHDGKQHKIFTPNPEMLVLASKDKDFARMLNSADLLVPDGFGLILAAWFLKTPFSERITGVELVNDVTKIATEEGKKIFLLGGALGVAEAASQKMATAYNLQPTTSSWLDGVKIDPDRLDKNVIDKINDAKPDILFVALGHGKQEKFMHRYLSELPSVKIAIGIGGALDFIAGEVCRAPQIFQKIGLEWLWRLAVEPRRLGRIINAILIFPMKIFLWKQ